VVTAGSPGPVWDSLVAELGEPQVDTPVRRIAARPPVPATGPQPAVTVHGDSSTAGRGATAVTSMSRAEWRARMHAAQADAAVDDQPTGPVLLASTDAHPSPPGDPHA